MLSRLKMNVAHLIGSIHGEAKNDSKQVQTKQYFAEPESKRKGNYVVAFAKLCQSLMGTLNLGFSFLTNIVYHFLK